jgi:hypothetical protein
MNLSQHANTYGLYRCTNCAAQTGHSAKMSRGNLIAKLHTFGPSGAWRMSMRMRKTQLSALLAAFATLGLSQTSAASPRGKWVELAHDVKIGLVESIRVGLIPYNSESPLRTTPATIDKEANIQCNLIVSKADRNELSFAMSRTVIAPQRDAPDVHWSVNFLDAQGRSLSKLYLGVEWTDRTVDGEFDGQSVKLSDPMIHWLDTKFRPQRWSEKSFTQSGCLP